MLLLALLLLPTLASSREIWVQWVIPSNGISLPSRTAVVGDTIVFNWSGAHDVWIHPTRTCDETGRILVGTTSRATYTLTESDLAESDGGGGGSNTIMFFACDVANHCARGHKMSVEVWASPTASPTVTPAPSTTTLPSGTPTKSSSPSGEPSASPTAHPSPRPSVGPTTLQSEGPTGRGVSNFPSSVSSREPTIKPSAGGTSSGMSKHAVIWWSLSVICTVISLILNV